MWRTEVRVAYGDRKLKTTRWFSTSEAKDAYLAEVKKNNNELISVAKYQLVSEPNPLEPLLEKAKMALTIIKIWAEYDKDSNQTRQLAMRDIKNKCERTLKELNDDRNQT